MRRQLPLVGEIEREIEPKPPRGVDDGDDGRLVEVGAIETDFGGEGLEKNGTLRFERE